MKNERTLGRLDISMGTSLALEGLLLDDREENGVMVKRELPKIDEDSFIFFNIETICRNYVASYNNVKNVADVYFIPDLLHEVELIKSICNINDRTAHLKVKFFKTKPLKSPKVTLRASKAVLNTYTESVYRTFIRQFDLILGDVGESEGTLRDGIVVTHRVSDLLRFKNNTRLLESNTGVLKSPDEFSTKYIRRAGKHNLDTGLLPFNLPLLYIYGDRNTYRSASVKLRLHTDTIARRKRWSLRTSPNEVLTELKRIDGDLFIDKVIKPLSYSKIRRGLTSKYEIR